MHKLFQHLVSAFQIDKEEQEIIKTVLSEQIGIFFKSKSEEAKYGKRKKANCKRNWMQSKIDL